MGVGGSFPWSEVHHSPPPSVEVKNGGAVPLLLHTSSWLGAQSITEAPLPDRHRRVSDCFLASSVSVLSIFPENTAVHIPTKGLAQFRVNNAIKIAREVYTLLSIFQQTSEAPRGRLTAIWQCGQQGFTYFLAYIAQPVSLYTKRNIFSHSSQYT
jgi:hypothetical protein